MMQRLPPAGWSRHHLDYPHRCIYCCPNLNQSEHTRPVSQLLSPPLPMPEPFRFPESQNNSTKNLRNNRLNDIHYYNNRVSVYSTNDSIRVISPVSDRDSISINMNDEKSEKGIKLKQKKSPMDNPPWWKRIYWGFLVLLNIYALIGSVILIVTFCIRANPFKVNYLSHSLTLTYLKRITINRSIFFSLIKMSFQITCTL